MSEKVTTDPIILKILQVSDLILAMPPEELESKHFGNLKFDIDVFGQIAACVKDLKDSEFSLLGD